MSGLTQGWMKSSFVWWSEDDETEPASHPQSCQYHSSPEACCPSQWGLAMEGQKDDSIMNRVVLRGWGILTPRFSSLGLHWCQDWIAELRNPFNYGFSQIKWKLHTMDTMSLTWGHSFYCDWSRGPVRQDMTTGPKPIAKLALQVFFHQICGQGFGVWWFWEKKKLCLRLKRVGNHIYPCQSKGSGQWCPHGLLHCLPNQLLFKYGALLHITNKFFMQLWSGLLRLHAYEWEKILAGKNKGIWTCTDHPHEQNKKTKQKKSGQSAWYCP